ncbi:MAG: nucleotide exchange factor GrpE [Oscillospiraceae bacterium]
MAKKIKQQEPELEEQSTQTQDKTNEDMGIEELPLSEVELLKLENTELNDKFLRICAEYDNFRKRSIKEKENIYPDATSNAVTKFLPLVDTFSRALACECSDTQFKKGIEMIYTNLNETLVKFGVETIGEVGESFSPDLHNAVMHVDDNNFGEAEIIEVFQKGFRIGDKVLQYAMVKVAN